MKQVYLIIPVLLMGAFIAYFVSYQKAHHEQEVAREQARKEEAARIETERQAYQKRVQEEARAASEAQAKARDERKALQAKEEAEWVSLNNELETANEQRSKLSDKLFEATNAYYLEQDRRERLEENLKNLQSEKKFLEEYLPIVKANRDRNSALAEKVKQMGTSTSN